ncbi:hypothetical protein TUM4438_10650 [Shewanella sairae]|uniref:Type I restriction endonuclease subunit M n=1 Tax=Shewanella sairae TaxID=190310 RepID=A0ABQ4P5V1_9GAMM|nr:hypothetical protein [Shewanella sairae]MCL1130498.1 hypothetical protein [Shewanella sairae]GIU42927.1 hypothetical protein TUM4438_10650 [Shewanella sairae]
MSLNTISAPLFPLGQVVMTQGINSKLDASNHGVFSTLLILHSRGDWGNVCDEDKAANDEAVNSGRRLMSAYMFDGIIIWIITEADRRVTTILLPSEY